MSKIARFVLKKSPRGTQVTMVKHAARGGLVTVGAVSVASKEDYGTAVARLIETDNQGKLGA